MEECLGLIQDFEEAAEELLLITVVWISVL